MIALGLAGAARQQRKDLFFGLLLFFLTISLSPTCPVSAFGGDNGSSNKIPSGQVLILNSYHQGFNWSDRELSTIVTMLDQSKLDNQPVIEYMDNKRYPGEDHVNQLLTLYRKKYQDKKFSLVVTLDYPAYNFAIKHHAQLFGETPVVFFGIGNFSPAMLAGNKQITGIVDKADPAGTIEVMLRLHPQAREILILYDYTAAGILIFRDFEAVLPRYAGRVRFRTKDNLVLADVTRELERLPQDTLVLLLSYATDKTGQTFDVPELTRYFSQHSRVPIYGYTDVRLGYGIVGGKLLSPVALAAEAATLIQRILRGEKASNIPVVTKSTSQYMFDFQQMERFHIPLSSLPANSIVINRPVSFYATHRKVILTAAVIIVVLSIVILLLIVNISQRRRSALALNESERKAKRLARESELIAEIGRIISSTPNFEEVYERFAEKVREAIPFDRIAVNTVNLKDYTRTIKYAKGGRFLGERVGEVLSLIGTGTEQAVHIKSSLLINRTNREDMMRKLPGISSLQFGAQSTMIIPLISKDEVIGALAIHSVKMDAYSKDDLLLAERMGSQIAGTIANAQLFLERKQAEEAHKEAEAKYYDLYEKAPDMYYSLDLATGTIKECNETFLRKTGYSKEEVIGRPIFELYDSDSMEDARKSLQQFKATGEIRDAERRVKCKDGRIIEVSLNVSAIKDKDGNIMRSRSIWHDITERKKQEEMIRALSITDQLTGLYNRRGFSTLAEQQLKMAERTRKGMLLLFTDVDDLKQINDQLGHKSGDEAIVETANILKEVFRKTDIPARMGGDEFAVLAPEASLEYADMIENRLRDQLAIHNSRAGRDYKLSLSIGMVYHPPPPPNSLDELISRADSIMYEQKQLKKSLAPH